jgi:hypothetical protein
MLESLKQFGIIWAIKTTTETKQMTHLTALLVNLSNERARLAAATKPAEIAQRTVWVKQLEREVAAEEKFTAVSAEVADMSDDQLFAELGA